MSDCDLKSPSKRLYYKHEWYIGVENNPKTFYKDHLKEWHQDT